MHGGPRRERRGRARRAVPAQDREVSERVRLDERDASRAEDARGSRVPAAAGDVPVRAVRMRLARVRGDVAGAHEGTRARPRRGSREEGGADVGRRREDGGEGGGDGRRARGRWAQLGEGWEPLQGAVRHDREGDDRGERVAGPGEARRVHGEGAREPRGAGEAAEERYRDSDDGGGSRREGDRGEQRGDREVSESGRGGGLEREEVRRSERHADDRESE
mmetsp:Transcript_1264/g.4185  ORF Transcript_1264/g.4185 Transcript_1264/m.4185 type:complete len:220 (+) Transcript_1264:646-1305(+)